MTEPDPPRRRRWVRRLLVGLGVVLALTILFFIFFVGWTRSGEGPRIGLSVSDLWYDRLQLHRAPYDLAIKRAGGTVVTLEPGDLDQLDQILDGLDGLLLCGGGDVDPALFGGDPSKSYAVDRVRDDFEIELLKRAEARGLPVLAICRGIQILAVAEGGRLRNLEEHPEFARRHGITTRSLSAHDVRIREGTRLETFYGPGPHRVNSFHVQAVADPGPQMRIAATDEDGVIEAIERPGGRWVVGIQWHPELQAVTEERWMKLFRGFVKEASRPRGP